MIEPCSQVVNHYDLSLLITSFVPTARNVRGTVSKETRHASILKEILHFLQIQLQHYLKLLKTFRPGKKI